MTLKDFYKARGVPDGDRIAADKNVLLVVPAKGHDLSGVLPGLGLSKWEAAVTWPKEGVDLLEEVAAAGPRLVLQVDCEPSRKFRRVSSGVEPDESVKAKVAEVLADAFVVLHHHDEFSIKDGLGTVEGLLRKLKAQRRSFCAVTNHGSVGGWIKQYNACKKAGVKAIFGMETYVSNYRGDDMEQKKAHRSANHLVLLARTKEGFDNIIRIHNDAQMNGFYYTPRANREAFEKWGKGVAATSACMAGEISRALMEGDEAKATETWEFYSRVFDRFYLELHIIEYEQQREANRRLVEFAGKVGAPLILACDSHYLEPEHSETHDLLMCIRQGKTIMDKMEKEEDVWDFEVKNLFYRDADQMWAVFSRGFVDGGGVKREPFMDEVFTQDVFMEAMANTRAFALEAEEIVLDSSIKLPRLYSNGRKEMRLKVNAGLTAILADKKAAGEDYNAQEYVDRVRHEFGVITKLGWTDYFLIMEKIVAEAVREHGEWAVGYGRGSAAGSLVSYCLGITGVDPIKHGLLFERFLDEGRPDPPDIDTDFDPRIRDWVKRRIVELFDPDKVCSIGTYQTYRTRAVILDVARVLGLDLGEASNVTKRIDPLKSFEDDEGEDTKVDKLDFDELCGHYPELKQYFEAHPEVRHHAEILRNQVKNMGTHAGGVIISGSVLKDKIPVLYDKPSNEDRQVISAWAESGNTAELSAVGLVKYDVLGLNNLPVISDCIGLVEKTRGVRLKRKDIPISDREAISVGSKDDLVGIFQLENPSTRSVVRSVGMESIDDVSAVTSLIRPGPKDKKMDTEYGDRKHGRSKGLENMPAILREMWADTYGVLTYQEQAMKVARELCGFTGPEANTLRKAIGKKLPELMQEQKAKFIKGAQPKVDAGEITAEEVEQVWGRVEAFAGYGFNKSVDIDSMVRCNGIQKRIGDVVRGDRVLCFDGVGMVETEAVANYDHGVLPAFEVVFEGGRRVVCSILHKFETSKGKVPLWKLMFGGEVWCAEEDEQLGMSVLRSRVSDEAGFGGAQDVEPVSCVEGRRGDRGLCGMRGEVSESDSVHEAPCGLREGDGYCAKEQVGEGFEEHLGGSCRRGWHDCGGKVGAGKGGVCRGVGDAGSDCGEKSDAGSVESDRGVQKEGVEDGDKNFYEAGVVGRESGKSAAVEEISPRGVCGESSQGKTGCEKLESGRVGLEGVVVRHGIQAEGAGSMRGDCEGSGFCEAGYMGGGGRMLAFRGGFCQKALSFVEGSREGRGAQLGSRTERDNVGSVRHGLLEGQREVQVETGVAGSADGVAGRAEAGGVSLRRVLSARFVGFRRMCDLEVSHPAHNFVLSNGVVTSNSHAICYSAISTVEMWLKYNYPVEYCTALINNTKLGKKKHGSEDVMVDYINYARRKGIRVLGPDVNASGEDFSIEGDDATGRAIRFSIGHVKNVATSASVVAGNRPYASVQDFYDRAKAETEGEGGKKTARRLNKKVVESLIAAGAFDSFGSRNEVTAEYHRLRKDKEAPADRTEKEWEAAEKEVMGLCLSGVPLYKKHEAMISEKGWRLVSDVSEGKRITVFGRVESVVSKISKNGNNMYVVKVTDGLDEMDFMVFASAQQYFRDNLKVGYVAGIPLSKFDDGDRRFFDDRGKIEVVEK